MSPIPGLKSQAPITRALRVVCLAACLFPGLLAWSQPKSGLRAPPTFDAVQAEKDGRALVAELLAQEPRENVTNVGVLTIRESDGSRKEVPVRVELSAVPGGWQRVYETWSVENRKGERLTLLHQDGKPNQYYLRQSQDSTEALGKKLSQAEIMKPFATSDFWMADLGLEFLHWPKQLVLRKDRRHERLCTVLQSLNIEPGGQYATIETWVDVETGGVVHAEAYDAKHQRLKQFDPSSLKRVNGQRQVEEIEMRNLLTGSRTYIKFNLKQQGSPEKAVTGGAKAN